MSRCASLQSEQPLDLPLLPVGRHALWFGSTGCFRPRIIAGILCFFVLLAGSLSAYPQRFEARLFGQDDGLDNLAISSIAQDTHGFLWVASQNGLFRYDGARFQTFGVPEGLKDPSVFTLFVDHLGTLWAGTHTGLFWFDGTSFQELEFEGASLRVGTNSMIAGTRAGEIIVATAKDIFSIERAPSDKEKRNAWSILPYRVRHASFPKVDDMNGIGVDASDTFWVGCGEAVCGFRDPNSQVFGKEQGVPPDFYMSFFLAGDGRMYARGRKNIVTWKPGDKAVTDLTGLLPPDAMKTIHRRFTQDSFGHILTPTASGLATWDGTRWTETNRTSQGDVDGASELFSDREGNLWIGTQGSGLLESLGYGLWKNYGTAEGLSDPHIFALATDGAGSLWAGHDKGASWLQPGAVTFAASSLTNKQDASQIQSLVPSSDGGMWVGALLGHIYHVAPGGKADIEVAIDTYIRRLRIDSAGTLWAGTSSGLYTLNCQAAARCVPIAVPGLEKAGIRDLAIGPKGTIWATDEKGIVLVKMSAASPTAIARVVTPAGLKDFDLLATANDGTLWLTSGKHGVYRLQIDQANGATIAKVVESHPPSELASNQIVSLDFDLAGRLWIGTDHGVNVLQNGKVQQLNEDDGLIGVPSENGQQRTLRLA
jgi:ligand-binding sensor domain-containing protein